MAKKKIEIKITHYGTQRADQFNANPLNPRIHPQHQRDVIRASLQRFGIISPVVVSKRSGYLIDGHERVWQALAEGDDTLVPYVEADVEEDKEAELILTYDKSTMMAEYDPVNLQLLMEQVNTDDEVLAKLFADMKEEYIPIADEPLPDNPPSMDKAEELKQKWQTERGQLWIIPTKHGEHRLLCGDSTLKADVDRVMGGDVVDLGLTDPPYGVQMSIGFGGSGGFGKPIGRRQYEDQWDNERPSKEAFELLLSSVKQCIVFGGNFFADYLPRSTHWIVWDKLNTMPSFGDCELAWTNIDRKSVKKITFEYNGLIGKEKDRAHPTQKPVGLFVEILNTYSCQSVFDPFGGSGTTMVACEQTGRLCRMIEIEPKYVAVILERMATLGLEPRLA